MSERVTLSADSATRGHPVRTAIVVGIALFMASLDNLIVTTALPSIREELHTDVEGLEWTVNGYTLTFAVFLMIASAVADRFGRKRLFAVGLAIFTGSSALAALSDSIETLITARVIQGLGAAIVLPLTLTLLSAAFPPEKRGAALGAWGGIGGLAVALGPLAGGLVLNNLSWSWIFWINVPIGIVLLALIPGWLTESHGPSTKLDLVGTLLAGLGMLGLVLGMVRAGERGWTDGQIVASLVAGVLFFAAFVWWEARTPTPMLPPRFFRSATFTAANLASLFMYFGMFGVIFLITQYLQTVQGASPLGAGVKMLTWTGMTLLAAPASGILSDRIGGKPIVAAGLFLQAAGILYLAMVVTPTASYAVLIPGFIANGLGMGLYYGPVANLVLGSVGRAEEGIASGANNAIRELGGVFGIAVLASIFTAEGGYGSAQSFTDGLAPALWIGTAVVLLGGVSALFIKSRPAAEAAGAPAGPAVEPVKETAGRPGGAVLTEIEI
ncbi:MFS transporter [Kitasatospora sp. NPDC097605]|uniref:MFS transporter n=1 Tax=Kitasatospora sp. NPDC097605 TaxID=3157226 RepID=UPI00332F9510